MYFALKCCEKNVLFLRTLYTGHSYLLFSVYSDTNTNKSFRLPQLSTSDLNIQSMHGQAVKKIYE